MHSGQAHTHQRWGPLPHPWPPPAAPPRRPYCPPGRSKTYRQHIISSSRKHEIEGEKCLDLMVTCWTHTEPGSSQLRRKHGQGRGQNQPTRCGNELRLTCRWSPGHMRRYPSSRSGCVFVSWLRAWVFIRLCTRQISSNFSRKLDRVPRHLRSYYTSK
jgi:hypothetical protein